MGSAWRRAIETQREEKDRYFGESPHSPIPETEREAFDGPVLESEHHRTNDGTWILDFNEAYNPTCAYADRYECPLPPVENWLEVADRGRPKILSLESPRS